MCYSNWSFAVNFLSQVETAMLNLRYSRGIFRAGDVLKTFRRSQSNYPAEGPASRIGATLNKGERVQDEVDVLIVGGGPAGLSAAIQLRKHCAKEGKDYRVMVLEKGSELGTSFL